MHYLEQKNLSCSGVVNWAPYEWLACSKTHDIVHLYMVIMDGASAEVSYCLNKIFLLSPAEYDSVIKE